MSSNNGGLVPLGPMRAREKTDFRKCGGEFGSVESCNPWNVPDWRQVDAYPELQNHEARWEFLRRNPEYRNDWELCCSHGCCDQEDQAGYTLEGRLAKKYGLFQMLDPTLGAYGIPDWYFFDGQPVLTEHEYLRPRFSHNVGMVTPRVLRERRRASGAVHAKSTASFKLRAQASGSILIAINPNQPWEVLSEKLKSQLKKHSSVGRVRLDQFQLLLRILDARSGDREPPAKFKEIARVIGRAGFSDEELRRKHAVARRYMLRSCRPFYSPDDVACRLA